MALPLRQPPLASPCPSTPSRKSTVPTGSLCPLRQNKIDSAPHYDTGHCFRAGTPPHCRGSQTLSRHRLFSPRLLFMRASLAFFFFLFPDALHNLLEFGTSPPLISLGPILFTSRYPASSASFYFVMRNTNNIPKAPRLDEKGETRENKGGRKKKREKERRGVSSWSAVRWEEAADSATRLWYSFGVSCG